MTVLHLWTDGSSLGNPGPSGWYALLKFGDHEKIISGSEQLSTNNAMELTAVLNGLMEIKHPAELTIHTDSRNVIGWCRGWVTQRGSRTQWIPWNANEPRIRALRDAIRKVQIEKSLSVVWNLEANESEFLRRVHEGAQTAAQTEVNP